MPVTVMNVSVGISPDPENVWNVILVVTIESWVGVKSNMYIYIYMVWKNPHDTVDGFLQGF